MDIIELLVDIARWSTYPLPSDSPLGVAMQQRINAPQIGDIVIEVTNFNFDPDSIGILRDKSKDSFNTDTWIIESLVDGKTHNWANCNFHAVPTKALRREVERSLHVDV